MIVSYNLIIIQTKYWLNLNDDFFNSVGEAPKGAGKSAFPADASIIHASHVQVEEHFPFFLSLHFWCVIMFYVKAFHFIIISFANVGPKKLEFSLFFLIKTNIHIVLMGWMQWKIQLWKVSVYCREREERKRGKKRTSRMVENIEKAFYTKRKQKRQKMQEAEKRT